MQLENIVQELKAEGRRINAALEALGVDSEGQPLSGDTSKTSTPSITAGRNHRPRRHRQTRRATRVMSASAKRKISRAMKKRWAKTNRKLRVMSKEARAKISAAQKTRWAKAKSKGHGQQAAQAA